MPGKVTIQDIADALGLSRNTVSKAINNTGVLADATRERILRKAQEMGYKQFSYMQFKDEAYITAPDRELPNQKREIALLFTGTLSNSHFSSTMLDRFQHNLSAVGFSMSMYRVMPEELASCRLPNAFDPDQKAGIMCIEIFDAAYCRMLCGLNVPLLFVDGPVSIFEGAFATDMLLMDNQTHLYEFMREMKRRGKSKIGFTGDIRHCQSFYERFSAFRQSVEMFGLSDVGSITGTMNLTENDYRLYLQESLEQTELPEVYICANDFVALDLLHALQKMNLSVPEDLWICGFDDSPESRIISPRLTTVHIHSQIMGQTAVDLLYSRILSPEMNYRIVYTETNLIYRESTGD